jgi:hypothetical protein
MKENRKAIVGVIGVGATVITAVACYVTTFVVCLASGYVLESDPVRCWDGTRYNTFYNQRTTSQDAFEPRAVWVLFGAREQQMPAALLNTVSTTRTTVNSDCSLTIDPNAGTVDILCFGTAADPNSPLCHWALR